MCEVEVRVLFFGKARELMDCEETKVLLPNKMEYSSLRTTLFHQMFEELQPIASSCILAVDQKYAMDIGEVNLTPSSEIAVIPPLSGG